MMLLSRTNTRDSNYNDYSEGAYVPSVLVLCRYSVCITLKPQINGVIMTNLPKSLAMMQELNLNVASVEDLNGRIYIQWGLDDQLSQYVPTEYEREVAHGCVFYKPSIHRY